MYVISFEKLQNHITWKGHPKVIESNFLLKPVSLTGSPSWLYPSQILNFSKDGESAAPSHSGSPPLDLHPSCTEVPQTEHKYNQSNLTAASKRIIPCLTLLPTLLLTLPSWLPPRAHCWLVCHLSSKAARPFSANLPSGHPSLYCCEELVHPRCNPLPLLHLARFQPGHFSSLPRSLGIPALHSSICIIKLFHLP